MRCRYMRRGLGVGAAAPIHRFVSGRQNENFVRQQLESMCEATSMVASHINARDGSSSGQARDDVRTTRSMALGPRLPGHAV
jgi:hypothetical protein